MPVRVLSVRPLTPTNQALIEAGKATLSSSVATSRDFCKAMITISAGGIAVFVAVLNAAVPKDGHLTGWQVFLTVAASLLYLTATGLFAWALFPRVGFVDLDSPDSIRNSIETVIDHRQWWTTAAFAAFVLATVIAGATLLSLFSGSRTTAAPVAPGVQPTASAPAR